MDDKQKQTKEDAKENTGRMKRIRFLKKEEKEENVGKGGRTVKDEKGGMKWKR